MAYSFNHPHGMRPDCTGLGERVELDEPNTGLHSRDVARLLEMLRRLVDQGNTVVVVEHRPELIAAADWVIDMGPGGGNRGGEVLFAGMPEALYLCPLSETGKHLHCGGEKAA